MLIGRNGILNFALGTIVHAVIPDSVTEIGKCAFEYCRSLQSVVIPDSVTEIGENAFYGCSSLQSVVIPDSVTSIREHAFSGCSSLQSVVIPDSVTSIEKKTFYECSSLQSVVIPDSVTSIGNDAFWNCFSLQSVTLAKHHFRTNSIFNALNTASIITCIALISDIPEQYRTKACVGFALHENEYPEDFRKNYLHYIRTHAAEICEAALQSPELLHLMCREKLIGADVFPDFLDESLRRESVETTAFLLEYKNKYLTGGASESNEVFSLE